MDADLDGPDLPHAVAHVWDWFNELHHARGSNGFGPSALAWTEVVAWADITRRVPTAFECQLIMRVDRAFRQAWLAAQPKK